MTFNKARLRAAIISQLQTELSLQVRAAQLARDEATHEESRAESKYDTHSQEAAYLAEGQARLAADIEESIALYTSLPLPELTGTDQVALGAVVELRNSDRNGWYFLGPRAGGLELKIDGANILVVTPQSPLGRQLLGRRLGDVVHLPGRGSALAHQVTSIA